MERFILTKGAPEIETVLDDAFRSISNGYHYLDNIYGYEEVDKWYHLDVSQLIKEYKLKVEKELKEICNKVSDPTIKEAFSRHLTEVTAQ
ncbi:14-3-3-like protein A, partial [Tanacetum coccineum]